MKKRVQKSGKGLARRTAYTRFSSNFREQVVEGVD